MSDSGSATVELEDGSLDSFRLLERDRGLRTAT
jgi:hypothetical protein